MLCSLDLSCAGPECYNNNMDLKTKLKAVHCQKLVIKCYNSNISNIIDFELKCKPFVADYYKFSRTDTGFVFGPINVTVLI